MKSLRLTTILAFIAVLAFAFGAAATERGEMHKGMTSGGMTSSPGTTHMEGTATVGAMNLHSADQFIGTEVRDRNGKEIGEVEDVMINFEQGRVGYAVVSGENDQKYMVPLSAFSSQHEGGYVTLNADPGQMGTAPRPMEGMTEQEYGERLHRHYGLSYPWRDLPGDVPVDRSTIPGGNLTYPGHRDEVPSGSQMETGSESETGSERR